MMGKALLMRILIFSMGSLLAGCGIEDGSPEERILPPIASPQPPSDHYTLADPRCQDQGAGVPRIDTGMIYQFAPAAGGPPRLLAPILDLRSLEATSNPSLRSRFVHETWFGARYVRSCPNQMGTGSACVKNGATLDWDVVQAPRPLRLCQANSAYPRESIEGIGLTSLHFLERALQALARGAARPLPAITLEVLPHYVSIYENERTAEGKPVRVATYYTHNLAYFPKRNRIAVFPESERTQATYAKHGHLWESAFGMAHEAGHHLEQQVAEAVSSDPRAFWDPMQHAFAPRGLLSGQEERARLTIRNMISEGFADIVAFYAVGGDERQVTSLYKLGVNRNPRSAAFVFENGQRVKVMDQMMLRQLLGAGCNGTGHCSVPPSMTAHDAGAVVAHALYRVFFNVAHRIDERMTTDWDKLIRLSFDWLTLALPRLATGTVDEASALQSIGTGLERVVGRLLHQRNVPADRAALIRSEVCLITRQVMPAMRPLPFEANGQCPSA